MWKYIFQLFLQILQHVGDGDDGQIVLVNDFWYDGQWGLCKWHSVDERDGLSLYQLSNCELSRSVNRILHADISRKYWHLITCDLERLYI